MKTQIKKPDYSVPALEKGLAIIEALAMAKRALTLKEIAEVLKRNSNEIFRMVDCLTERGYVLRDAASGEYRLSLRLFELAHAHSPVDELLRSARRPMEHIAHVLGECCHLGVRNDTELMVLSQAVSREKVRISIESGSSFPLALTASGKLLLAYEPEAERIIAQLPAAHRSHVTPSVLATIRKQGYCLDVEETTRGVIDLAVLTGKPDGGIQYALTISALRSMKAEDFLKKTLPILKMGAEQIRTEAGLFP